jgi:hypothetical protein
MPRLTEGALAAPPRKPRELLVHPSGLRARGGLKAGWSFFFRVPSNEEGRWRTYTLGKYGVGVGELLLPQALERMREKLEALEEGPEAESSVDAVAEGFLAKYSVRDERGRTVKAGRPARPHQARREGGSPHPRACPRRHPAPAWTLRRPGRRRRRGGGTPGTD